MIEGSRSGGSGPLVTEVSIQGRAGPGLDHSLRRHRYGLLTRGCRRRRRAHRIWRNGDD